MMGKHSGVIFTDRPMRDEADFWRVRSLLVETVAITPIDFNWDVRRWDGQRFYNADLAWDPQWAARVQLWETQAGELAGAVHPEGKGDAHLQLHPAYRHLEEELVAWAEAHLAVPTPDGRECQLAIFVYAYDDCRQQLLAERGYEQTPYGGVVRRLPFSQAPALPPPTIAEGYHIRTTRPDDLAECQRMADLLNAAFGRTFHNAQEYQNFTRCAPSFVADLDLVAEAPDGSLAAYVGVPYDETNRRGIFEPVCTHPEHRRKGLARALMVEGLRRLAARGAVDVIVGTGDMVPANRLYDAMGFTEVYRGHIWKKIF